VQALEKLVGEKVRAIGVSNFNIAKLEKLAKVQKIVPAVNQVRKILYDIKNKVDIIVYRSSYTPSYLKKICSNTVKNTTLLVSLIYKIE
jgi:diketogulonate reductase-like aldo/keto reductase